MASQQLAMASALAAGAGIMAHIAYFNRNEHHLYGWAYVRAAALVLFLGTAILVRIGNLPAKEAVGRVASLEGSFLAGIFTSLIVYRAFLHPLNKFPGPFGARISNFWYTFKLGKLDAPKIMSELHEKYGEFVRIGSSDLSITHPESVNAIYGPGSKCTKAPWYDQDDYSSLHTTRSRPLHDKRRRMWSSAFSDKALRGYEDRIKTYTDELGKQIAAFSGKPLDATKWFNLYSFDVMGDLAFGKSFDMLVNGEAHWAIKLLNEGMEPLGFNFPPWFFRVLTAIPGLSAGYWKFIHYCTGQLESRMKETPSTPDIMSSLLQPYEKSEPTKKEWEHLKGDSRLIIVAGSDTTAATLTHLFYHLAKDPSQADKIREEIKEFVNPDGGVNHVDIQNCEHLNGAIYETLRLNPPVPTAVHRLTPPEGITIGDTFVPGNMDVWCPQYVIGRKENIYPEANKFYPERWYSDSDKVLNKTAWAPFSAGPMACIGKPLALLEIRTVTAKLLTKFNVDFGDKEDGHDLLYETKDHFTLGMKPLMLTFKPRKV